MITNSPPTVPRVDRFLELRPFYRLCWAQWILTTVMAVMVTGNGFAPRNTRDPSNIRLHEVPLSVALATAAALAFVAGVTALFHVRAHRRDRATELVALTHTTGRLRRRLDEWKVRLSKILPVEGRAEVAIVPGEANVMWTQRGRESEDAGPLILLTPAFWSEEQSEDELTAAFAHEAGHVAAADVLTFKRLWWSSVALSIAAPALITFSLIRLLAMGGVDRALSLANHLLASLGGVMAMLASWSALLCARELQADAFATDVMEKVGPMRDFLRRRTAARNAEVMTLVGRLWRWLVQPDLAWRATLPGLQGRLGTRIEMSLGFSLVSAMISGYWVSGLMGIFLYADRPSLLFLLFVILYVTWLAFQFSWWRASAWSRVRQSWVAVLVSWARFTMPATAFVLVFVVLLQSGRNGNLAGRSGVGVDWWRTLLVVLGVQAFTLVVSAFGATAHAVDMARRLEQPTVSGALLSGFMLLVVVTLAWFSATVAGSITGTNMLYWFAVLAPAMTAGLAYGSQTFARERIKNRGTQRS